MTSLLLWVILLAPQISRAEQEIYVVKCTECVNYNCGDTANSKGFCFRIYLSNMCASECEGSNWTGAGATCKGELVPKPYFVGKAPVQPCTFTSTGTRTKTLTSTSSGTGTGTKTQTGSATQTQTDPVTDDPTISDSPSPSPSTLKAAKIETETAKKDAATFKQTVSVIKLENEKSAQFFEEKKRDLDLGKPLTDVLRESAMEQGGLLNKAGAGKGGISKLNGEKFGENQDGSFNSDRSSSTQTSSALTYDSKKGSGKSSIGSASDKGDEKTGGSEKPAPMNKIQALELLRARLKQLIEEKTSGARAEATEIKTLIEMIEGGKIEQVEEAKLIAYLNSKPEFHLDENETRAAIRDLIGEFEDAQIPDTDLFQRIKDAHKRSVQSGKVRAKRK